MVGVPRSKGCISCRARRKGCDAQKPACSQCLRRGDRCPGYATALKMVMVQPGVPDRTRRSPPGSSTALLIRSPSRSPAPLGILPSLLSTAFRSQTYERFVTYYTPQATESWERLPTNLAIIPSTSWLQAAVAAAPTDPVLNNAVSALALAQVGRTTAQPDFLRSSEKFYSKAVSGLNKKLKNGGERLSDATLAAASVLSLYEMQEGAINGRSERWASHVKGASALIQLRGRANFSTPLSNRVFLGMQIAEFVAAIGRRERSKNSSLWSETYQGTMSDSGFASSMCLFEILHLLPEIMKEGECIEPLTSTAEHSARSVGDRLASFTQQCRDFEISLKIWYDDVESRYQIARRQSQPRSESPATYNQTRDKATSTLQLFWFEPSTLCSQLDCGSSARIFPFFICFVDPDIAYQIVLHWTGLLLMYSTLHLTHARLQSFKDDTPLPQNDPPTFTTNPRTLALLIAQSLEYFVHPDMGLLGTNIIGFPLAVAQGYFQQTGAEEAVWFNVIFERIGETRSGLKGFLDDMAKGNTVKLVRP